MKNFKVQSWIFPMPVLMIGTYDENGNPNVMNAAWGMISDVHEITISLSNHKTTQNLLYTNAFTVGFATESMIQACDYAGIVSASQVPDKFDKAGFHQKKSEFVNAPVIEELKVALECKVKSYKDEILIGEIVNVCADEEVLTDGQIDLNKLKPVSFDPIHHMYYSLGKPVAQAFQVGKGIKNEL